jgi:hypothetical protein
VTVTVAVSMIVAMVVTVTMIVPAVCMPMVESEYSDQVDK